MEPKSTPAPKVITVSDNVEVYRFTLQEEDIKIPKVLEASG